jgi:hypothetical protein
MDYECEDETGRSQEKKRLEKTLIVSTKIYLMKQ